MRGGCQSNNPILAKFTEKLGFFYSFNAQAQPPFCYSEAKEKLSAGALCWASTETSDRLRFNVLGKIIQDSLPPLTLLFHWIFGFSIERDTHCDTVCAS